MHIKYLTQKTSRHFAMSIKKLQKVEVYVIFCAIASWWDFAPLQGGNILRHCKVVRFEWNTWLDTLALHQLPITNCFQAARRICRKSVKIVFHIGLLHLFSFDKISFCIQSWKMNYSIVVLSCFSETLLFYILNSTFYILKIGY